MVMVVSVLTGFTTASADEGSSFVSDFAICHSDCEFQISIETHSVPKPAGQPLESDHGCSACGAHHSVTGAFGTLAHPDVDESILLPTASQPVRSASEQRLDRPPILG